MTARKLLGNLRQRGVVLEADEGRITVDAPCGVIDNRLRGLLTEHKPALVKLLQWERRKLREAKRLGLVIEWAGKRGWISLHDPTTGEWHEVQVAECLPSVVEAANSRKRRAKKTSL